MLQQEQEIIIEENIVKLIKHFKDYKVVFCFIKTIKIRKIQFFVFVGK